MRKELVIAALDMAIAQRKPDAGCVHHSDQGLSTRRRVRREPQAAGINMSMGRRGCALDNATCEAFFASLERELTGCQRFDSRAHVRQAVFEWIEVFYNRRRLHSTLGNRSPAEFEEQHERRSPKPIAGALERLVDSLERNEKAKKLGNYSGS
jgi:putative transposase